MPDNICSHIGAITTIKHAKHGQCDECMKIGADWVHLRICQECGATRCCDDSPNRHATKHAHASKHPVIASAEPGERWLYCYPDDAVAEYLVRKRLKVAAKYRLAEDQCLNFRSKKHD